MGLVGCYSLVLYCDDPRHTDEEMLRGKLGTEEAEAWSRYRSGQFDGRLERDCIRAARRAGWIVRPHAERPEGSITQGVAICPYHAKRR